MIRTNAPGRWRNRNLDFEEAIEVFSGVTLEILDARKAYGEARVLCYGYLRSRLVMVGYTMRGETRHVFSMRKANEREKRRFAAHVGI